MGLDIAMIKTPKGKPNVAKKNWTLLIDHHAKRSWSKFRDKKSDMPEPICEHMNMLSACGRETKHLHLDGAGENKTSQQRAKSKDWKLNAKFEFMP